MTIESITISRRRSHEERNQDMQDRLIAATIKCLDTYGYSGLSLERMANQAGVSKASAIHHFGSKAGLVEATANELMSRLHQKLTKAITPAEGSTNPLKEMLKIAWETLYGTTESLAFSELLIATRREPDIAEVLIKLSSRGLNILDTASNHYFISRLGRLSPTRFFIMTHWFFQGLALHQHLLNDDAFIEAELDLWADMLSKYVGSKDHKSLV